MATLLSAIRDKARKTLLETSASFWTDAELLEHEIDGCKDLWKGLVDLHQEHFQTVDATNVSMAASTSTLTGVPTNMFRVLLIEPRVLTPGTAGAGLTFLPRDYASAEFQNARSQEVMSPDSTGIVYYAITQAGAPVAAPTIQVAPQISAALLLRLVYIPVLGTLVASDANPIPGESDNALYAWTIAYARAKERDDRSPDPNWLAIYATEKQAVLTVSTPRQEQEPEYVEGMFAGYWGSY